MLLQGNESYETARLVQAMDDEPRFYFLNAVRKYADENDKNRQVRLIEAIIRTSRSVADDPGLMPEDVQDAIISLMARYRAFGPSDLNFRPTRYADARNLIKAYLF